MYFLLTAEDREYTAGDEEGRQSEATQDVQLCIIWCKMLPLKPGLM